jgi:mTERF domain-containing protein
LVNITIFWHDILSIKKFVNKMACQRTLLRGFLNLCRHSSRLSSAPVKIQHQLNPLSKLDTTKKEFIEDLVPPLKKSFNLASYVNSSETLQELIKLGVSLFDIENTNPKAAKQLVLLDYEKDCVPYIRFLVDHGLKEKNIGRFISEYPNIFQVPIDDLSVRIKYLSTKGFTKIQISRALNRSCHILAHDIKTLDHKLGEFQIEFQMPAKVIRDIVSKYPPVIALPNGQYKMINFTLTEEFGFKIAEVHLLLKEQPKILDILRSVLIERLDLVHNTIGLSHEAICKFPKLLTGPTIEIRHRFEYLERLKRNQFNPNKPLYVPPSCLYSLSDEKFCKIYAKTSLEDYKLFLKNY